MRKMTPLVVSILICLLLLTACGKKGPVRPLGSPPPVPQPCESCDAKQ